MTFDVTIRDLLTHTAGFMTRAGVDQPGITIGPNESLADVLPRFKGVSLDFEPGTRWAYSGQFGFDVLARAVEVAAGMPFVQFAAREACDTFAQL
jgi:CubicO group peptidase (beta-lactamase class C family)